MSDYNYSSFPLDMTSADFREFPRWLKAGDKAPDAELVDVRDGSKVKLSDYWASGPVMIEFGSIT